MKKIIISLFTFLFFAVQPHDAYCWQYVQLERGFEDGVPVRQLRDMLMDQGFRAAVSQEVVSIIPGEISQERLSAVMGVIQGRVSSLVQGYRRVVWTESDHGLNLEMEVSIDSSSLRSVLQENGTYYTSLAPWYYNLSTRGASPEDFSLLRDLQLISGVMVDSSAETSLSLEKSMQGLWSGRIVHGSFEQSTAGYDLESVWFELWGYIFSQPPVRAAFVSRLTLTTQGWSTTDSLMFFDSILESWPREVEQRKIKNVIAGVPELGASWEIHSLNPYSLQERLDSYLAPRGIEFQIIGK